MAKRNNDNQPIEDILKQFVQNNNLQSGLDKVDKNIQNIDVFW